MKKTEQKAFNNNNKVQASHRHAQSLPNGAPNRESSEDTSGNRRISIAETKDGASGFSKVTSETKRAQRQRTFKKDSIIYGIPIKNATKTLNNSEHVKEFSELNHKHIPKTFKDYFILSSNMKVVQIFGIIMLIFAIISTLTSAVYACFGPPSRGLLEFDYLMEFFFLLDIIRNFFMEYEDFEERKIIRDHKMIAKRYLKGAFIVDLIAILHFPVNYGAAKANILPDDQINLLYLMRFSRLPKIGLLLDT